MRVACFALCLLAAPSFALPTANVESKLLIEQVESKAQSKKVESKKSAPVAALQHIAVMGASLSAGMGLDPQNPFTPKLNLSKVVEASLKGAHDPVMQQASLMFFMDPIGSASTLTTAVKAGQPTLIVGLDYLFWFGYGSRMPNEADRLALLEKGLETLEDLACPILVGDFPDMSLALKVSQPVLPPDALPSPEALKKLNARLRAWAATRKNVIVLPVAELTAKLVAGEEIRVRGNLWPKGSMKALMQADALHTTLEGTTLLWIAAVDKLLAVRKEIPAEVFDLDARSILLKLDPNYAAAVRSPADTKAARGKTSSRPEPVPAGTSKSGPAKKDESR